MIRGSSFLSCHEEIRQWAAAQSRPIISFCKICLGIFPLKFFQRRGEQKGAGEGKQSSDRPTRHRLSLPWSYIIMFSAIRQPL